MKIRIETDESFNGTQVIIKCRKIDDSVLELQKALLQTAQSCELIFYKEQKQFYFPLNNVLFFDTDTGNVIAHTKDDTFSVKQKLYELEKILPHSFIRISKSAILNTSHVYSVDKHITSFSTVCFYGTPKRIYASRGYLKGLLTRLDETRTIKTQGGIL